MPYVEVVMPIACQPEKLYPFVRDMEKYSQFMQDLTSVEVIEREEHSTTTKWVSNVDGRIIKWTEKDIFDDDNYHISYQQIDGDLKKFAGEWILTPIHEGTEIKLTVDFEFGIPMIAGLLNPILKKKVRLNSENMLKAIKAQVEKSL